MVSDDAQSDPIYDGPDDSVLKKVMAEKGTRKNIQRGIWYMKQYDLIEGDLKAAREKRDNKDRLCNCWMI
jgi:hypothetical protein